MRKMKRNLTVLLVMSSILLMCACSAESLPSTTAAEVQGTVQGETAEAVAAVYNDAVQKLLDAKSYTMTGSINSSSAMGDVLTSVVTMIDCKASETAFLIEAQQSTNGADPIPHSTYCAEGKYYISVFDENYFVSTNDFGDFDALGIVKRVEDTAISNFSIKDVEEGGKEIRFEIPFGVYASEALDYLIGMFADDSLLQQPVTLVAKTDASGMLISAYISVDNTTTFDDARIEQSIVMSLKFSDFDATVLTVPNDLNAYEDRENETQSGQNPDGVEVPESFDGDSLD